MRLSTVTSLGLGAMLLTGCQTTAQPAPEVSLVADSSNHISQGVYLAEFQATSRLASSAQQLSQQWQNYCQQNVSDTDLQQSWQRTMSAWMALQGQERGPNAALDLSWQMQFWPDKKNTTGRKLTQLLKQEGLVDANYIGQQSVAVQGLGALEWLLYDSESPLKTDPNACQTGEAISEFLAANARQIAIAWQTNPWQRDSDNQWYAEYIALLSNQLDYSMKKLSRPLANIGQPRPYFAESWRSKTSMANLQANLVAMRSLYLAQNGLDEILRQRGRIDLADSIKLQFDHTLENWPQQSSLFDMLNSREGYRSALSQYNKLEQLKFMIHEEVAVELGVVIGFNATDGD
ncbi:imelysin family protein [Vibrio sp.]|uniref:imelysin family protein n=1 Tax=Vibrio sp. TaxID=678 RepID=UPI003D0D935B